MRELDDERPIPLGRARAGAAVEREADATGGNRSRLGNGRPKAPDANRGPLAHGCPEDREFLVDNVIHQEPNRGPHTHGCPQPAEPSPARPVAAEGLARPPAPAAAHIERTRAQPDKPAAPPSAVAVVEPPAAAVVPDVAAPIEPADQAPGAHPMAGLRRLRMDVELAASVHRPWPEVLRNLAIGYVVVIGSVLGLLAAFLALTGTAGSAHP